VLDGDHGCSGNRADEGDPTCGDGAYDVARCGRDVDAPVAAAPLLVRRVVPGSDLGWGDGPGPEDGHEEGSEPGHGSRMIGRPVARSMVDRSSGWGPMIARPVDGGEDRDLWTAVRTWCEAVAGTG
jgi:hypothetical protein